jgi:riboflavin transporter FmnP
MGEDSFLFDRVSLGLYSGDFLLSLQCAGITNIVRRSCKMKTNVKKMATVAVLSALSIVLMLLIRFPILPAAPYLIYEPADVPVLIGGFLFGPAAGFVITVIVSTIQAFALSTDGWVGLVMHIIATGSLVITASTIYRVCRNKSGAVIALAAGTLAMTLVMIPTNLIIQPRFYGVPVETVKSLLIPAVIPFNLIKAGANSLLTFIVYKSISRFVKKFVSE